MKPIRQYTFLCSFYNLNLLSYDMDEQQIEKSVNKLFKTTTDNYIFIYTPPKVGSTTLVSSLIL